MHSICKSAGWILLPLVASCYPAAAQVRVTAPPAPYQAPGNRDYQRSQGGYITPPAAGQNAGSELSQHLSVLASNPQSIPALTGAGKAALELDDPEAALTFFGRAEELSPRDGIIKAGIGSAMVLMEQPEAALQFFYEAVRLGVPAMEFAGYRGLAYDLTGDPPRAQQDYQLALRRQDSPEVRRRFALSLGISGQRDAALSVIDPQLRRQDRAAWRARAFILALTGDPQGATRVVESVMPYQAAAMAPFLARLPTLGLADRARAVHFGHFPGASVSSPATPTGVGGPALPPTAPATAAGRPDPAQRPFGQATVSAPAAAPPVSAPPPAQPVPAPGLVLSSPVSVSSPPASLAPGFSTRAPPALAPMPSTAATVGPIKAPPPTRSLSEIATLIAGLNDPIPTAKPVAATARKEPPPPKEPSRSWVQISRAPGQSALASEYRRIKAKAPELFAGKAAWSAEMGNSNRLLVGPFKSNKEAQDFVNRLAKEDLSAFSWTSASGQEIKKLPSK